MLLSHSVVNQGGLKDYPTTIHRYPSNATDESDQSEEIEVLQSHRLMTATIKSREAEIALLLSKSGCKSSDELMRLSANIAREN